MNRLFFIAIIIPFFVTSQQYLTFNHNGFVRDYIYYEPIGILPDAPLLFVAHGYSSSAQNIMNYSGFNSLADQYKFAVCYPEGTSDNWGNNFWNVGYLFTSTSNVDDVGYLTSLAQHLQNSYNLSSQNTFVTGMSNGAELCYLIACENPGVFKAYAPVSGTLFTDGLTNNQCYSQPTPIFEIHGANDNVTLFNGDLNDQFWGPYLSVDSLMNYWSSLSGLYDLNIDTLPNFNNNNKFTVSYKYSSLNSNNEVWLYKHLDGHSWFVDDITVEQEIWDFFTKYITSNVSLIETLHKPKSRKLIKIINVLGQQSTLQSNQVLLYLYDDGFVRKLIHVK